MMSAWLGLCAEPTQLPHLSYIGGVGGQNNAGVARRAQGAIGGCGWWLIVIAGGGHIVAGGWDILGLGRDGAVAVRVGACEGDTALAEIGDGGRAAQALHHGRGGPGIQARVVAVGQLHRGVGQESVPFPTANSSR